MHKFGFRIGLNFTNGDRDVKKIILASAIALSLAGCATGPGMMDFPAPPSQQQISSASYGDLPSNYKEQVTKYVSATLLDPYSAKIEIGKPYKAYSQNNTAAGGLVRYGWAVPVMTNAKNAYGGYTGYQPTYLIFDHGTMYDATLLFGLGHLIPVN